MNLKWSITQVIGTKMSCANLTQRQSEKLFAKMQKIQSDGGLLFFQKRMKDIKIGETEYDKPEVITGYQYIVKRER